MLSTENYKRRKGHYHPAAVYLLLRDCSNDGSKFRASRESVLGISHLATHLQHSSPLPGQLCTSSLPYSA